MRTVIVGGGVVGSSLAEHLLKDKHQLSLVEQDPALCLEIGEKLDLQIVTGSGSSPKALEAAGLADADMVLAVTPSNEVNLIACAIAAQLGVRRRIARLRGREFGETGGLVDLEALGVTRVIRPEQVLVDQIMQFIETPHAVEAANFEDGKILLRGYRVTEDMELANKTPREIRQLMAPDLVLFAAVVRDHVGMIPDGDMRIIPGDIVYSLFPHNSLERFLKLVNIEKKNSRKIIITGDSYVSFELAEALEQTHHHVTFVDPNLEHANEMAAQFNNIEVLHGDCTQVDLLREIRVDAASFFIALSDGADYNMLSTLLARSEGAHEVIATTPEPRHDKLFQSIGIDHVINPRVVLANEILEIIARGRIGAVFKLSDVDIEAVRLTVEPESFVAGKKIIDIARKFKMGSIVGVIVRDNRMILPEAETVVEANDNVIVITHQGNQAAITKLFRPSGFFSKG